MFRKKYDVVESDGLENMNFTNKKNPAEGIASFTIGIVSIIVFLALVVTSTILEGNGWIWLGFVGCLMGLGNVLALYLAIKALRKEDVYRKISTMGVVINGVASLGYLGVYVWGALMV